MPSFTEPRGAVTLILDHYRPTPDTVVVVASGDVDASDASELITAIEYAHRSCDGLVLDLTGVGFFSTHGLQALDALDDHGRPGPRVALVPSPAVARLVHLCPTAPSVPLATDVDAALAMVRDRPSALRQAV